MVITDQGRSPPDGEGRRSVNAGIRSQRDVTVPLVTASGGNQRTSVADPFAREGQGLRRDDRPAARDLERRPSVDGGSRGGRA